MCGIFGYIGKKDAFEQVCSGLKLLQYRGYDSCGIAYFCDGFKVKKAIGTLNKLTPPAEENHIAFGHTRWATNGKVNLKNTHPHTSFDGKFFVVHNGIITNADQLKTDLKGAGVKFNSDTDTEVIVNLLASLNGELEGRLKQLYTLLKGSFSLIIGDENGCLYLLKQFCPLNILRNQDGIYISSDCNSLKNGEIYSLKDGDILKIEQQNISAIQGEIQFGAYCNDINQMDLDGFPHYMLKEINETPQAILDSYTYLKQQPIYKIFKHYKKITFLGCGTAYHSCLIAEELLSDMFECNCFLASNYKVDKKIKHNHLHIIVSQSGETADCIKIANEIKAHKGKILILTNQRNSTITKYADFLLLTQAKKELAVASTKTYCAQVFTFAYIKHILQDKTYQLDIFGLKSRLEAFIKGLDVSSLVPLLNSDKLILIARDIDYLTILEASLKIREIDYIYTIPMISSELKHGTLSLIDENAVVIALNTNTNSNMLLPALNEIKSREGKVIEIDKFIDFCNIDYCYKPIFAIIPFQLISYQLAVSKGLNPDMPRNLAKSVTVE